MDEFGSFRPYIDPKGGKRCRGKRKQVRCGWELLGLLESEVKECGGKELYCNKELGTVRYVSAGINPL